MRCVALRWWWCADARMRGCIDACVAASRGPASWGPMPLVRRGGDPTASWPPRWCRRTRSRERGPAPGPRRAGPRGWRGPARSAPRVGGRGVDAPNSHASSCAGTGPAQSWRRAREIRPSDRGTRDPRSGALTSHCCGQRPKGTRPLARCARWPHPVEGPCSRTRALGRSRMESRAVRDGAILCSLQ